VASDPTAAPDGPGASPDGPGASPDGPGALADRAVRHGMLRAALELAVVVARTGADARPPVPAPPALRPFLRHTKWTPRALTTVRQVIDDDDGFRARVATAASALDGIALDAESRSWLVRPDGWQERLGAEVHRLDRAEAQKRSEKDERSARRQLAGLTAALERRTAEVEVAEQRAQAAEADAAEQRRLRRDTVAERDEARAGWDEARCAGEGSTTRIDDLTRELAEATQESAERLAHLERLHDQMTALVAERDRLTGRLAEVEAELGTARAGGRRIEEAAIEATASVAAAVSDAAEAAQALGIALARAAGALAGGAQVDQGSPAGSSPVRRPGALPTPRSGALPTPRPSSLPGPRLGSAGIESDELVAGPGAASAGRPSLLRPGLAGRGPGSGGPPPGRSHPSGDRVPVGALRSRRQPLPLPPAVFEDSPEAAVHLVRTGVLLLVDGYNVSLHAWPGVALAHQRHRLISALAELAARSGAAVRVIFDGDETQAFPPVPGAARAVVRVAFSAPGVDADEVIIEAVEHHPVGQAVVVATDDRRVQDEVRRRGANVLTTPQLLGLLRRADPRG
jgi:predicted RNA-binding protein with PIN domain